ncbi:nuclear transport factor 2 family protein [Gramella lutea]|uniref:Nuclear transport factor 2 family protein n=1 Tax=Christiangramia lutea TaxID=1607951 RepID=A0A9X2A9M6_9FLAO|nr:nuclear transport factor 2 family protein [Christiangramia lutea]MCH4823734.1 nuclear transport factor 2 family protein [Christiangramia lutea]
MKNFIIALLLLVNTAVFAQNSSAENTPEQMVKDFFEAFHRQDTLTLSEIAYPGAKMESVSKDADGNTKLSSNGYSEFLKSIASIPAEASFEEKLLGFRVEKNGLLATVTTPYSFYYNGNFSHCGVNSFQLVNFNGAWKIVHLIDTRTKEGCD